MEIPSIHGQTSLEIVVPKLLILCAKFSEFPYLNYYFSYDVCVSVCLSVRLSAKKNTFQWVQISKNVSIQSCHIFKKNKNGHLIFDFFGSDPSKMDQT